MEQLAKGNGIPDRRGVWTAEDDVALMDEPDGMERMIKKHGSDHVEERIIWLEVLAEMRGGIEPE